MPLLNHWYVAKPDPASKVTGPLQRERPVVVAVIVWGDILTEVVFDVPGHPFPSTTDKL